MSAELQFAALGIVVAVVIHGFGGGMLVPNAILPLMRRLSLAIRGRALGGFTAALYLGQFLSPLVVLGCAQAFGGLRPAIVSIASGTAATALLWLQPAFRSRGDD